MNKFFRISIFVICAVFMLGITSVFAQETQTRTVFAGGMGTEADPWQIENAEQLLAVNEDLTASYVLVSDIDLSEYENWPMIGIYVMDENSEEGEDPIPEFAFSGVFDGNGHTISNLIIDATEDFGHMFGVGMFAVVGEGGVVKNLTIADMDVKGMMLVGGVVGYAFKCIVDNVHITVSDPNESRNTAQATLVMVGGIIGGLTLSECTNNSVEYTDIIAAPGGNSGILGGGFSKPVLENCSVSNSTITAELGEVPMFGMTEGAWIGGLTGCVNLDDFDTEAWYVKNCSVEDSTILVSGTGGYIGGLIGAAGNVLDSTDSPRMQIQGCTVDNVQIIISDELPMVGGLVGGGFSEGGIPQSVLIDGCTLSGVSITTDAMDLEESATGMLLGDSWNSQYVNSNGEISDITENVSSDDLNSRINVTVYGADDSVIENAPLIGRVISE